ncbi:MAG: pyridoxal 5'-phosphate synthase glutaminase subunit PdxT, partial [Oscillospiraceae bacterium]|nr:pyridoxal 5'-phosphate synthase glutaminase subunit PdxT [Oscillospiraceae bacterium]
MTGILAVQGAFAEHAHVLDLLSENYILIRKKQDIPQNLDRLILVGGESTVQSKLIHELDLFQILRDKISENMPVLGTCAGLILLAKEIQNQNQTCFGTLPVYVKRNAYGR